MVAHQKTAKQTGPKTRIHSKLPMKALKMRAKTQLAKQTGPKSKARMYFKVPKKEAEIRAKKAAEKFDQHMTKQSGHTDAKKAKQNGPRSKDCKLPMKAATKTAKPPDQQADAMNAEIDPPHNSLPNFTQLTGHEIVECSRCGSSGVMKEAYIVIRLEPASTHAMCAQCWVKRTSERLPYF